MKKKSVKKSTKFEHEMFRHHAMHMLDERLVKGGLDTSTMQGEERMLDVLNAALKETYIREMFECSRVDPLLYYKKFDTMIYSLIRTKADVAQIERFIENNLKHIGTPGFEPLPDAETQCRNFMFKHVHLMTLLAGWHDNGKLVYSVSPDLCRMLQHTRLDNVPNNLIRMPSKDFYLTIPRGTWPDLERPKYLEGTWGVKEGYIDGFHVHVLKFNEMSDEDREFYSQDYPVDILHRAIHIQPMSILQARTGQTVSTPSNPYIIPINDDYDLGTSIQVIKNSMIDAKRTEEDMQTFLNIVNFVSAALIYATSKGADVILSKNSKLYAQWADIKADEKMMKSMTKRQRKGINAALTRAASTKTKYLGGGLVMIDRHGDFHKTGAAKATRKKTAMHYRQGHFRVQPYGPRDAPEYKTIFIAPQIVGSGAPLQHKPHHMR